MSGKQRAVRIGSNVHSYRNLPHSSSRVFPRASLDGNGVAVCAKLLPSCKESRYDAILKLERKGALSTTYASPQSEAGEEGSMPEAYVAKLPGASAKDEV